MAGMIVPQYWAEGRAHERRKGRQVTVRRWGWSDESLALAQAHADGRAREAFDRVLKGEELPRREAKVAYNGAEGVPIREEIISRHGETIVTRNGYGALCLNTPDVLFADIDFGAPKIPWGALISAGILAAIVVDIKPVQRPVETLQSRPSKARAGGSEGIQGQNSYSTGQGRVFAFGDLPEI